MPEEHTTEHHESSSRTARDADSLSQEAEQRRYWKKDLRYKLWSFCISILGFALVVVGLSINFYQTRKVAKSVAANILHSTANQVITLDRLFVEKPELRPYFYNCKPLDDKDDKSTQVQATAELMLDVFDVVADQSKDFAEYYERPEAWDTWIIDMFGTSPVLRDKFQQSSDWYAYKLKRLYEKRQIKGTQEGCK